MDQITGGAVTAQRVGHNYMEMDDWWKLLHPLDVHDPVSWITSEILAWTHLESGQRISVKFTPGSSYTTKSLWWIICKWEIGPIRTIVSCVMALWRQGYTSLSCPFARVVWAQVLYNNKAFKSQTSWGRLELKPSRSNQGSAMWIAVFQALLSKAKSLGIFHPFKSFYCLYPSQLRSSSASLHVTILV